MRDLETALAELISVTEGPAMGRPWVPADFVSDTTGEAFATVVATVLNAVLSGQLIPLETCNARVAAELAALQDPLVVHLNMVAGKIAKPLPSQLVHIYGEDTIRAALDAMISRAREVKPLVFTDGKHYGATGRTLVAHGILGKVEVTTGWENGKASASRSYSDAEWFGTEDEAIAFLQTDYTARIHAALRANATDASEGER